MRVSIRSTLALVAVAGLGFAAGRYAGRDPPAPSGVPTAPITAPASAGSSSPTAASVQNLPRVPDTVRDTMRLRGDFAQTAALYWLASGKDKRGIEELLREAAEIKQRSGRRAATFILYERYAELDPEAAIEHIMSRDSDFDPGALAGVFHAWARTDLDAAIACAKGLDERSRMAGGTAILRSRDDLPRKEREAIAKKLDLHVIIQDPSAFDLRTPEAALRSWRTELANADDESRQMRLHSLVEVWARQDPHATIRAIESLQDRGLREQLLQQGLHAWAQKNAMEAVAWTLARPPSHERMQLLAGSLSALVTREPSVAMSVTERLSNAERQQVIPQVLLNWSHVDPSSAAAWAAKLDNPQLRHQAMTWIASNYAMRDPDGAIKWAASLPAVESQQVLAEVIQHIANSDPARAGNLLNHLDRGPHREGAIAAIAQNWAQWDPQAALGWLSRLPDSDVRPSVFGAVFGQWANYDADSAVAELSQIYDANARNAAILGILDYAYADADLARKLFPRVEGADARREMAMRLYHLLSESDPQAAERYRIEAGIPAELVRQDIAQ